MTDKIFPIKFTNSHGKIIRSLTALQLYKLYLTTIILDGNYKNKK